jgi:hypothetical protein
VYLFYKHYGRAVAFWLKALIYVITLNKMVVHRLLRFVTRGRSGRSVTSYQDLHRALSSADSAVEETVIL